MIWGWREGVQCTFLRSGGSLGRDPGWLAGWLAGWAGWLALYIIYVTLYKQMMTIFWNIFRNRCVTSLFPTFTSLSEGAWGKLESWILARAPGRWVVLRGAAALRAAAPGVRP